MAKYRPLPSQEFLLERFNYNQETGILTWKRRPKDHFVSDKSYN